MFDVNALREQFSTAGDIVEIECGVTEAFIKFADE